MSHVPKNEVFFRQTKRFSQEAFEVGREKQRGLVEKGPHFGHVDVLKTSHR